MKLFANGNFWGVQADDTIYFTVQSVAESIKGLDVELLRQKVKGSEWALGLSADIRAAVKSAGVEVPASARWLYPQEDFLEAFKKYKVGPILDRSLQESIDLLEYHGSINEPQEDEPLTLEERVERLETLVESLGEDNDTTTDSVSGYGRTATRSSGIPYRNR